MVKKYHYFGYVLSVFLGLTSGLLVYFFETGPGVTGLEIHQWDMSSGSTVDDAFALQSVIFSGFIFGTMASLFVTLLESFRIRVWFSLISSSIVSYVIAVFIVPGLSLFLISDLVPSSTFVLSSIVGSFIFSLGIIFSKMEVNRTKVLKRMLFFPLPAIVISIFVLYWANAFSSYGILGNQPIVFATLHPLWQISILCALASSLKRARDVSR